MTKKKTQKKAAASPAAKLPTTEATQEQIADLLEGSTKEVPLSYMGWKAVIRRMSGLERLRHDQALVDVTNIGGKPQIQHRLDRQPEQYLIYLAATVLELHTHVGVIKPVTQGIIEQLPHEPFDELVKAFEKLNGDVDPKK